MNHALIRRYGFRTPILEPAFQVRSDNTPVCPYNDFFYTKLESCSQM